jgi:glycosyltransferase involved in cell wall biosynthesis
MRQSPDRIGKIRNPEENQNIDSQSPHLRGTVAETYPKEGIVAKEKYSFDLSALSNRLQRAQRTVSCLESLLKDKNDEIIKLQGTVSDLESQLKIKITEVAYLHEMFRQRESSLSWRFSQFYGKYFSMDSRLTRFILYLLNKSVQSLEHRDTVKTEETRYYKQELESILKDREGKIKGIIIYPPTIDWNIFLFQRPQQLALKLSDLGYLFFFSVFTNKVDKVKGFYKERNNCYLTNQYDLLVKELPEFALLLSSTCIEIKLKLDDVLKIKDKALIIYDYIDEIHPDISGPFSIDNALYGHDYVLKNSDIVVATADKLLDDVTKIREKSVYLIPNGVEYGHFHIQRDYDDIPSNIKSIIKKGNPIIGYYGAFAKWFDYELVKEMAKKRPNYEIILIGVDYDGDMRNQGLEKFKNIHYLGGKKYPILPKYAVWFDVATIPFVLNKITESTSPIKIFEYMALGKPIVTTDLRECRKYKSVLIGKDYEDFIEKIDEALKLRDDPTYLGLLDKEAKENTWEDRARKIDEAIQEHFNLRC